MAAARRVIVLAVAAVGLVGWTAEGWLSLRTHHFYLEERADIAEPSSTRWRQAFRIRDGRVVPQIHTEDRGILRFRHHVRRPSVFRVDALPLGAAAHELAISDAADGRVIARWQGDAPRAMSFAVPLAPADIAIELRHVGRLVWSDPQVDERASGWRALAGLTGVLAALVALVASLPRASASFRRRVYACTLTLGTALACAALLEGGLRLAGVRLPQWLLDARETIGDPAGDPGSEESPRYLRRHAPDHRRSIRSTVGDIVWMGFVPPDAVTPHDVRHDFVTDAEGFRNERVRDAIHVAALGDSFTDGMMVPVEETWPARLERALGRPVQNYGTAGFSAPQESLVLEEFALPRRPRVVVVAFFTGNDIPEAADFTDWLAGRILGWSPGWPIAPDLARHERLFVRSLADAAMRLFAIEAPATSAGGADPRPPSFARGLYVLARGGRRMEVALMPPTLRRLSWSPAEIEAHPGWKPTVEALRRMKKAGADAGARVLVMLIPSRCQVFLPLLDETFGRETLRRQLATYFPGEPGAIDVDRAIAYRLAQNERMAALCAREDLAFLDLTPLLEAEVGRGASPYFAHDTHWNRDGHRVAAEALAAELRRRGWDRE